MLKALQKKKLLESLKSKNAGGKSSMKEGTVLEEEGETPKFEKTEDESNEQVKKPKKHK
jgi:hypothetical protein